MQLLSPDEMRRTDVIAIQKMGIPSLELMENAGKAIADEIAKDESLAGMRVAVLAGKGNNGGDGFVVARLLAAEGAKVTVYLFGEASALKGDARENWIRLEGTDVAARELPSSDGDNTVREEIASAGLIVDALLGTGFSGTPRGRIADAISIAGSSGGRIIAVDAPSGVDGMSGLVRGEALAAQKTVTLGRAKQGLLLYPARQFVGELIVVPIGIPDLAIEKIAPQVATFERTDGARLIPARPADAHKGSVGRVLVAGGTSEYVGAPLLAGLAALRSGAGLVTLGVPRSSHSLFAGRVLEIMCRALDDSDGALTTASAQPILEADRPLDALAIGPGLSRGKSPAGFVRSILEKWEGPLLVDADGLHALAGQEKLIQGFRGTLVLTPHLGELETLTGIARGDILNDRIGFVQEWAVKLGAVLLLKGNPTLVADPDGRVTLNTTGNAGMATAGTGDVLTGVILALLGQGLDMADAARLGVWLHGRAGDLAALSHGEAGLIATDLIEKLPESWRME